MNSIVIGKRITAGQIIAGFLGVLVYLWDMTHPENKIDANVALLFGQMLTGIAQIVIVNYFGITQKKDSV